MAWREKSYEVLPALSVRGVELRRVLRTVTIAGMFAMAWIACVSGSHIKVFSRMLGFNDFAFGVMSAIPYIATFAQLPASVVVERSGLRKYLFIYSLTFSRVLWLAVAAIPFLMTVPSTAAVVVMLLVLTASNAGGAVGYPAWMSWMGDLIPRRIRGRYLGARSKLLGVTQVLMVVAIGIVLDAATTRDAAETYQAQPVLMWVVCGLMVLGAVTGVWDILLFHRIREVKPTRHNGQPPVVELDVRPPEQRRALALCSYAGRYVAAATRQLLLDPMKDRGFRHYVYYGAVITFAMTIGSWFYWLNAMDNLGFSKLGANVVFLGIGSLSGIFASRLWGRLIDRWGRRPTLMLATLGTIFAPVPWLLVRRDTPAPAAVVDGLNWLSGHLGAVFGHGDWMLIGPDTPLTALAAGSAACIIGGAAWTGVELARIGITMGFADGQGRSKYVAASSVLSSIGGILGGVIGGIVAQALEFMQDAPMIVGPFLWNNWHVCFALSVVARAASMFWLVGMPDPGSGRFRDLLRLVGVSAYNVTGLRLLTPFRLLRSRRQGK